MIDNLLKEFYIENSDKPFVWGESDCSHFSAQWVKKFIGKDIESDMPEYTTEAEALAVLTDLGYTSQEASLDHYFGRVNKRQLMRGDLVGHYFHEATYMAIGIFAGESCYFKSDNGVYLVPYKLIDKNLCWRVS